MHPVTEVAIVAALGLVAGICGKAFQIQRHGLNVRIILVAQSDITEGSLKSGIFEIVSAVATSYPAITHFVDFNDYATGVGLTKTIALRQSMVNVVGDIGTKLVGMTKSQNSRMVSLRAAIENPDQITPSGYSLISEITPGSLRKTLTASVLESNFVHSFMMLEYFGGRPPEIAHWEHDIPKGLHEDIVNLCEVAISNMACHHRTCVEADAEASLFLATFDRSCDSVINGSDDDVLRRVWDKAHEKAIRVAALLAVADDCRMPIIKLKHAEWARDFVLHGIGVVNRHIGAPQKRSKKKAVRG